MMQKVRQFAWLLHVKFFLFYLPLVDLLKEIKNGKVTGV